MTFEEKMAKLKLYSVLVPLISEAKKGRKRGEITSISLRAKHSNENGTTQFIYRYYEFGSLVTPRTATLNDSDGLIYSTFRTDFKNTAYEENPAYSDESKEYVSSNYLNIGQMLNKADSARNAVFDADMYDDNDELIIEDGVEDLLEMDDELYDSIDKARNILYAFQRDSFK